MWRRWVWRRFLRDLAWALGWAIALAVISPLSVWFTVLVLVVFWPVFSLGINSSEPGEPAPRTWEHWKSHLRIRAMQLVTVAVVAAGVAWYFGMPYGTAFAYSFLVLVATAAMHGALIDWEDNQPGGILDPTSPKDKL